MSRKDQAYNYIRNEIVSGRLKSGLPIRENDISEILHMSRTPIREALKNLEAEGVVVSYASHGTFVAALTPYDVEEIFELRSLLEIWALEKSINRITDAELDYIENMLKHADESGKWEEIHAADLWLHNLIVEKNGSKRLVTFMNNLYTQIERISITGAVEPKRKADTFNEHISIINSIRSRDLKKSQTLLRNHLRLVAEAAIEIAKTI